MKRKVFYMLLILAPIGFLACNSDDKDTEKPVIADVEPENGDTLVIGREMHFEAELSDNEKLASYKVEIHHNFGDGHGHKSAIEDPADSIKFSYSNEFYDIKGLRNTPVHKHIDIPAQVDGKSVREGKYHFIIYCLDEAGNMQVLARDVVLSRTVPSNIHVE